MNYRTIVKPKRYDFEISFVSNILMLGSCFSENIGNKLIESKFNVIENPFGIQFNPISIANTIHCIINKKEFSAFDLIQENGLYHSFSHHGCFSSTSIDESLKKMNNSRAVASIFLKKMDTLIITFGSAFVYRYIKTGNIVANCHKVPNKEFKKEILEINEIITSYEEVITLLKKVNPAINIVFTISPVRHWKDGVEENNLSKAILNVAVHKLVKLFKNVHYFPSYEMVIDDLRDYRFFKEDMLHPNSTAIDYVWKGFKKSFFSDKIEKTIQEIERLNKSLNHIPIYNNTEEHKLFLKKQLDSLKRIQNENPLLNFDKEFSKF